MVGVGYVVLAHYLLEYFEGSPTTSATKDELLAWAETQPFWKDTNPEEIELAFYRLTDLTCAIYTEGKLVLNEDNRYICPLYRKKYYEKEEKRANLYVENILDFIQDALKRGGKVVHITRDDYSLYHCSSDTVLIEKLKGKLPPHYTVDLGHTSEIPVVLYISW